MKTRFSELAMGTCFLTKRSKAVKKKLEGVRVLTIGAKGRVRTRDQKGDPEVRLISCPLRFIGTGLRKNPEAVVEIGDGRPRKRVERRLR